MSQLFIFVIKYPSSEKFTSSMSGRHLPHFGFHRYTSNTIITIMDPSQLVALHRQMVCQHLPLPFTAMSTTPYMTKWGCN